MFVYESLGSAQPCPGSAILPSDYMQTTGAAPLESTAKTEEKKLPTAALVVGGLLVGGGILWLMSGGAIVLDNPKTTLRPWQRVKKLLERAGWSYDEGDFEGASQRLNRKVYVLTDTGGERIEDPAAPATVGVYALDAAAGEWVQVGEQTFPSLREALSGWQFVKVDVEGVEEGDFYPGHRNNPAPRASIEKAVEQMRVYLGSVDYASLRVQQRLYNATTKSVQKISEKSGLSQENVWKQIEDEARKRGIKKPMPGQHFDNPGLAAKRGITRADVDPNELRRGVKHEMEHTDSPKVAERIALDHLAEDSRYYTKLEAVMKNNPLDNSTLAIGAAIGAAAAGIAWLLARRGSTTPSTTATGPLPAPPTPLTTPQATTAPLTSSAAPFAPASPQAGPTSAAAPLPASSPSDTASFGDVYAPFSAPVWAPGE